MSRNLQVRSSRVGSSFVDFQTDAPGVLCLRGATHQRERTTGLSRKSTCGSPVALARTKHLRKEAARKRPEV